MSRLFDLPTTPIDDGVTVVEASAGTGKTYCLVGLALRLLLERRVRDVSELLVVTFTNAATQELVARLRSGLAEVARLLDGEESSDDPFFRHLAETYRADTEALRTARDALARFDDLTVSTIHGFCRRVLDDGAFESGEPFEGELVESAAATLLEAARDVWRRLLYVPGGDASGAVAAVVTEEGLTPESFLPDFALAQRHPRTEILPPAEDLEAATAALARAREALASGWDSKSLRALLEPRRFKRGSFFAGTLARRLEDAEAFLTDGEPAGLRSILELAGHRLEPSLFQRDRAGVTRHPAIAACTAFDAAIETFRHALRCRFIADLGRRFEADKRARQTWTYDDLLRRFSDALDDPRRGSALARALRRRYRAALIDEFQDTDLIQYRIFHRLFRRGPLILIGDPKQAIYRFRGADVFAYLSARGDADRVYTLDRNWRAEKSLVEAVNAVFGRAAARGGRPFVFEQIAFEPVRAARAAPERERRPPLQWIWVPRLRRRELAVEAIEDAVTHEIVRLLAAEASPAPSDLAVLVRTNQQAASLQSTLAAAGVPAVIGRSGDIFDSEEMAELETLLAAVADPGDGGLLRAALATRLWGASDRDLRRLHRDDEALARTLERFAAYRRDWRRRGFMPMLQRLLAENDVRRRLISAAGGERRLTNLDHAASLLHRAERERHRSPAALAGWLAAERARDRLASDGVTSTSPREDTELRLESDEPAVQVATVHRSKGLEYEIVFCPYLWQARAGGGLPVEAHRTPRVVLDYGSPDLERHRAQAEAERLSEEARLAYVALTRARRRCYVVWGDVPGRHGPASSALGYLLHGTPAREAAREPGDLAERALAELEAGRESWQRQLQGLIAAHEEVMELRSLEEMTTPAESVPPAPAERDLRPRPFRGSVPRPWSLESFSSLSRPGPAPEPGTGPDDDAPDVRDPALPAVLRQDAPARPTSGVVAFARGRRAGSCLHRVLERCDLARLDDPETGDVIAEALRRFDLDDPRRHAAAADGPPDVTWEPAGAVYDMLRRLAAAPVPGSGLCLGAVPRAEWLVEWRFTLPLGRVTPRRLARAFRDHGRGAVAGEYPAHLETLTRGEVHGYLTGFVDLLFPAGGRWHLIDWKSNDLGAGAEAYGAEGMWRAMSHHHYVLQYHLYLLALHRFLARRVDGYDYRRHVAGAFYVFLRGLGAPATGDDETIPGWYVDRPPRALIEALDELIGGRG